MAKKIIIDGPKLQVSTDPDDSVIPRYCTAMWCRFKFKACAKDESKKRKSIAKEMVAA